MASWDSPVSLVTLIQVQQEFPSWHISREFGELDAWKTQGNVTWTVHGHNPRDLREAILNIVREGVTEK